MKAFPFARWVFLSVGLMISAGWLVGCASTPPVDWTARMGEYTYDQAVVELGPPTKQAKLADGRTVADWVTRTRTGSGVGMGVGGYTGNVGMGVGTTYGGGYRDLILRLTFGTDGKLESWSRNY
jgi:hypothetical protein